MEEKYLITIKGTMEQNGERESVELMTRGKFAQRNGAYYIVYAETEATGYAGCTTTVKLSADAREVVMTRFGKAPSQLVIEKGVRHICHYETGFGSVSLGVAADEITPELGPKAGGCSSATRWIPAARTLSAATLSTSMWNSCPKRRCPDLVKHGGTL